LVGEEQATAKARTKYRDLSTALLTIKLCAASVEMTCIFAGWSGKTGGEAVGGGY
jgi:hypothetical protein